jgi:anti-sigma-K factor RskA
VIDNGDHVVDDLAAYALGSLETGEHARVDAHLAACASCASHLAEYRVLVGVLPLALAPVEPPPDLWDAIRSDARRRRNRPSAWRRMAAGRGWFRATRWVAAAAVAAGLVTWNVQLQSELTRYAQGPQVEKLARRPARLVILSGAARPQASARVFAAVDGQSGHMAITGLPPLSAGRVYQLWFLPKAGPALMAATFTVDTEGRAWVVIKVPADLDNTRSLIVTEETAPGSPAPTGPPLLEARAWR